MKKPDRPKVLGVPRRYNVELSNGETVEIFATRRAEARHYSISLASGWVSPLAHYCRVRSVRLAAA